MTNQTTKTRESFVFYRSFFDAIKELESEKKAEIYDAIFSYSFEEKEPKLSGVSAAIFTLIKPQLDANRRRFENGSKEKKKSKTKAKQKQSRSKTKANDNVNDNVNVNVNPNENDNLKSQLENLNINLETWQDFVAFRKEIKKEITPRILKRLLKDLASFEGKKKGNANLSLEISIRKSWQDIYEPKLESLEQKNQSSINSFAQEVNNLIGQDLIQEIKMVNDETVVKFVSLSARDKWGKVDEAKKDEAKSMIRAKFNDKIRVA